MKSRLPSSQRRRRGHLRDMDKTRATTDSAAPPQGLDGISEDALGPGRHGPRIMSWPTGR